MKRFFSILFVVALSAFSLHSTALAIPECGKGFKYSRYDAACIPIECPTGTHYSYTGTECLCNDESLHACTDPETGIATKCVPKSEICIVENNSTTDETNIPIVRDDTNSNAIKASISKLEGDVEYQKGGQGEFLPLTADVVLEQGDIISTGFESEALLSFGDFTQVKVYQMSQILIDESFSKDNIIKTRMHINTGSVAAKVRHTPSIRSDFSVGTQNLISAGIRDSEMLVSYDKQGNTVIYSIEDKAYVQVNEGDKEYTLAQGYKTSVNDLGDYETDTFAQSELPTSSIKFNDWVGVLDTVDTSPVANSNLIYIIGAICMGLVCLGLLVVLIVFMLRRNSKKQIPVEQAPVS
jgi:hypothetical protein